eukprot:14333534-Alexandrium_andersonii.AAC.1
MEAACQGSGSVSRSGATSREGLATPGLLASVLGKRAPRCEARPPLRAEVASMRLAARERNSPSSSIRKTAADQDYAR